MRVTLEHLSCRHFISIVVLIWHIFIQLPLPVKPHECDEVHYSSWRYYREDCTTTQTEGRHEHKEKGA